MISRLFNLCFIPDKEFLDVENTDSVKEGGRLLRAKLLLPDTVLRRLCALKTKLLEVAQFDCTVTGHSSRPKTLRQQPS